MEEEKDDGVDQYGEGGIIPRRRALLLFDVYDEPIEQSRVKSGPRPASRIIL